jgi:hypothetical protein
MTISDFFNTSFLFSIAIIIILTCGIFAYINYKMSEQDHKLTSMVSLVTVLAQDLHLVKNKINVTQTYVDPNILQYQSQMIGGENNSRLISVSDGEDSEDEDENEDDIDEDDIDEDDDEDDDDEEEDENDDDIDEDEDDGNNNEDDTKEHIKLLNLTLANDDVEHNLQIEELNTEDLGTNVSSDIKTIHIENENEGKIEDTEYQTEIKGTDNNLINEELSFLKNVSITDLGDIQDLLETKPEYKKMSLNRLREIVVNKGIIADASKLKKNDILKLLGDE